MKISRKIIAISVILGLLQLNVFVAAQTSTIEYSNSLDKTSNYSSAANAEITKVNKEEKGSITNEVKSMWQENVRQYQTDDGSYIAATYAGPVNYFKDGQWVEIDNTLISGNDSSLGEVYQNTSNSFKATFSKSSNSIGFAKIEKDNYSITWSLDSDKNSEIDSSDAEVINYNQVAGLSDNEKIMDVGKSSSAILYKSVFSDIDLKYTVSPEKIKEDIILNKPSDINSFIFNISSFGLKARINADKTISFINTDRPDEVIFCIPAPYMTDSSENQELSRKLIMDLTETDVGYKLVITPDPNWVNAPERVFPIYIDPTISSSQVQSNIVDTYVHSGDTAGEHALETLLVVGTKSGQLCRSLIKTTIPTLPGVTVSDARLNLSITSGTSTWQNLDVYRINSTWSSSTMTWAIQNSISKTLVKSNVQATSYSNSPSTLRYSCDITGTIQDVYEGSLTNYGFMVKYNNESIADYNRFYSSDYSTSTVRPTLVVTYTYAQTSGITNNGVYYIKNKNSGKYMDVSGAGTDNGTDVIQWHYTGATNQQWKAIYMSNGTYKLMAMNTTDKYLEVEADNNNNGTILDIYGGDFTEQYWYIMKTPGASSYRILSKCSSYTKGATVEGASSADGATIFQYTYTTSEDDNDDWYFKLVSGSFTSAEEPLPNANRVAHISESEIEYDGMTLFEHYEYQEILGTINTLAYAMVLVGGILFNEDDASDMMNHYLSNQGTDYTVDFSRLVSESSIALERHNEAIENAQNSALQFYQQSQNTFYNLQEIQHTVPLENSNWNHAINLYSSWITCEITSYNSIRITDHLRDFYNWDKDVYSMGNMPVSPHDLWMLHYAGYARQYQVFGEMITSNVPW